MIHKLTDGPSLTRLSILLFLMMIGVCNLCAQERLKFAIADFDVDPFDLSAKDKQYEKYDGNGDRYAIIKVTSNNPEDDLSEYNFNFGNLRHEVVEHEGVLWLYVQRNAKLVTITRNGYYPINKYDLHTTIESGKNYVMSITSEEKKVYAQMVKFNIKPINSKAVVMVKSIMEGSPEMLFGYADTNDSVAKSLEYGVYTYKVLADNFHMAEGRFTLNNKLETLIENVDLRPNFSDITFNVDADADIYINGEKKGTRQWSGALKAGNYQVECRQLNHRPTSQHIQVTENDNRTINLNVPEPILGIVSVTSAPLGADIKIDGNSYGQTPKNIEIVVGEHTIELSKDSYKSEKKSFSVKEDRMAEVAVTLGRTTKTTINSTPSNSKIYIDGAFKGNTPYTYEGEVGEHKIKLLYNGFKPVVKSVYLGNSDQLSYSLMKQYVKTTDFYIEAGIGIGQVPSLSDNSPINIDFAIGGHYHNFNLELSFNWLEAFVRGSYEHNWSDIYNPDCSFGIKLGYGFSLGNRFKITPQLGYRATHTYATSNFFDGYVGDYQTFSGITIGTRAFCAISKRFGVSCSPEYSISGNEEGRGFNVRIALSLTF